MCYSRIRWCLGRVRAHSELAAFVLISVMRPVCMEMIASWFQLYRRCLFVWLYCIVFMFERIIPEIVCI